MTPISQISLNPICVYWYERDLDASDSTLYFHADYPNFTFDEFCLKVIIPAIKSLQSNGNTVHWGYVSNSGETLDEFEQTCKKLLGLNDAC